MPLGVDAQLAAEDVTGFRWWPRQDIVDYNGPAVFAPRDLGKALTDLLTVGLPPAPIVMGL